MQNYATMRMLRTNYPSLFLQKKDDSTYLTFILKHGDRRNTHVPRSAYKVHLSNPSIDYDFCGEGFMKRTIYLEQYIEKRASRIFGLFKTKMNTYDQNRFISGKKNTDVEMIAEKIARFAGY